MAETGTKKKRVVVVKKLTGKQKEEAEKRKSFAQQHSDAIKRAIVDATINERNADHLGYVPRNEDVKFGRNLGGRRLLGDSSVSVGNNIWVADTEKGAYNATKQSEKDLIQNLYAQAAAWKRGTPRALRGDMGSAYQGLLDRADRLQAIQLLKDYFNPDKNKDLYAIPDDAPYTYGRETYENPAALDTLFNLFGSDRGLLILQNEMQQ